MPPSTTMVKAISTKALPALRVDVVGRQQQAGRDREARGAEAEASPRRCARRRCRTSSAPSFSLATARIALPVSVQRMMQPQRRAPPRCTTAKAITRGTAMNAGPISTTSKRVGQVDGARVGAERIEQRVLDHDGEAERHQQDVVVLAVRGRADDEALQAIAEREEQRRQRRPPRGRDRARAACRRRTPRTSPRSAARRARS